ncbi:hypothetical protein EGK75_09180 [Neisseria weixii]|uniref:Uncharacterized protein n=1 Tax=Neisseria weixii TaxID=1853276 RepID=A0A3N4N5F8_9NEIS|nr:hypothetical protein [Neisseria weixii]RPD86283.1 hypothetical protein EGK75_09180 [Neisseria weixii]RPD89397.1 hypothetical protein EGK74_04035 [Neisseria weixii]
MANTDVKKMAADKVAAAKNKAAAWKRKQKPLVEMPELTGNPEVDSKADLDALKKGFRDRLKQESARKVSATDSEYWSCICFQTRAQADAFVAAMGWGRFGDKYIDGVKLAKAMGIELPDEQVAYPAENKVDKTWASFVDD